LFYLGFTGRTLDAIQRSDWRPMVMIALGCCLALALGFRLGLQMLRPPRAGEDRPEFAFSFKLLVIVYVASIVLEGGLNTAVRALPSMRQIVVTFDEARLGVLYLLLRRFYRPVPQCSRIVGVVGFEVILGVTGFFAGFREPLVLAGLAMLEIFDRRNMRHWTAVAAMAVITVGCGLVWMGIRTEYRQDYVQIDNFKADRGARIARIGDLVSGFLPAATATSSPDVRQLHRSDVADLLSGPGRDARAAHTAAYRRRYQQRRTPAHHYAAGVLPQQG
jgi:hypothetical protein